MNEFALKLKQAAFPEEIEVVRQLFQEYAASLQISLCFQNFEQELAGLPGKYAAPAGRLLLAQTGGQVAGCVALRPLEAAVCEMKRLFVRPAWRRHGVGRALCTSLIEEAKQLGYQAMRLDTLASMHPAISLYESLGFQRVEAYYENPSPEAVFMELDLRRGAPANRMWGSGGKTAQRITSLEQRESSVKVPKRWRAEVERVLIGRSTIAQRVRAMAKEIEKDLGRNELVVVSLLNGTIMFLADLVRNLSLPLRLDFIGVSSYRANTESGELVFTKELRLDVRGRDVLLVDDILDTGRTIWRVRQKLTDLGARRISVCVLLDKPSRRVEPVSADYVGFEIPDVFVVGYGLDFAEKYRHLPFVGVLSPGMYSQTNVLTVAAPAATSTK